MPVLVVLLIALTLTACGQSGALYFPEQAPPPPTAADEDADTDASPRP